MTSTVCFYNCAHIIVLESNPMVTLVDDSTRAFYKLLNFLVLQQQQQYSSEGNDNCSTIVFL